MDRICETPALTSASPLTSCERSSAKPEAGDGHSAATTAIPPADMPERSYERFVRDAQLTERYLAGATVDSLAREYGLTKQGVRYILVKRRVPRRPKKRVGLLPIETVAQLMIEHERMADVALALGISERRLRERLLKQVGWLACRDMQRKAKHARDERLRLYGIRVIQKLAQELGRTPSLKDMREAGLEFNAFRRLFGGLREAQAQAGLAPNKKGGSQ